MDILIKSFNRPFYLDRCISSIYQFVEGDFSIKVLDDGTPEKYLTKIQEKFPDIIILKSDNYLEKERAIEENLKSGGKINGFQIPTYLWFQAVQKASPYFIITEDDVWFTEKINVNQLEKIMNDEKISLIKLGWLGNNKFIDGFEQRKTDLITTIFPNLFTAPYFIMDMFFYNKYKFFSLLYRLGLVNNETISKYWILNSILMGMFKKEYWLEIWKDAQGKVNEKAQLLNASMYYRKHKKESNFISQLNKEAMKTTFISSATNSYHQYDIELDIDRINYILNENWLKNNLDSLNNFPKDFSIDYIAGFLEKENHPQAKVENWKKWIEKFKQQYADLGSDVE